MQVQGYIDMSDLLEVLQWQQMVKGTGHGQCPTDAVTRLFARRPDEAGVCFTQYACCYAVITRVVQLTLFTSECYSHNSVMQLIVWYS